MAFFRTEIPYPYDALQPAISRDTVQTHYGKHHAGYVQELNDLVDAHGLDGKSLEELIREADRGVRNNAAQVYNHDLYWLSMTPGGSDLTPDLKQRVASAFGSVERFHERFLDAATGHFASGWAWLVTDDDGRLEIVTTPDAENPLQDGKRPLLTCDLWEHAYYLDYKNERGDYVEHWFRLVNWETAHERMTAAAHSA